MYFSVSSVMNYLDYITIHFHHIQFLSKALWPLSYSKSSPQKTFLATRISNQLLYSNSNLEYIWVYLSGLLLQLKREGTRARGERRHRQSFSGNCQTMIHMFNSPIYPLDEGNEDVGSVRNFIFFLFSLKQVHCFCLNSKAQGEYLIYIVLDKIPELRESISPSNFYGQGPNS